MKPGKSTKLLAALALVPLLGAPTAALAVDTKTADYVAHALECAAWLLSDPAKHAAMCLPQGYDGPSSFATGSTGFAAPRSSASST